LLSAQVQSAAFAVVHAEAGSSPREPGGDAEATVATELRPGLALRVATPRSSFLAKASPRMYYQTPHVGELERPLFLGQGDAIYSLQLAPRLRWLTTAAASYGEVDYLNTDLVLDTPAESVPEPVMTVLNLRARTGFDQLLTTRYSLEANAFVEHTSYGETSAESLPSSTGVGLELTQLHALSPRDTILFPLFGRYSFISDDPDWITVAAGVGYRRVLDPRTQFDGGVGVAAAKPEGGDTRILPRGMLAIQRTLLERAASTLINRVSLALDTPLDPTLGEVRSVVVLDIGLTGSVGRKFTQRLAVSGSTPAFQPEVDESEEGAVEAETSTFSANGALGYRLSDGFQLETGVRYSTRASDFGTSDADFTDQQLFWFVGFSTAVNLGGERSSPDWAL
jgi:hypothetical protein